MKVFVAGASGAVGRRMIPQLQAAGHSVVAVTRDAAKAESLSGAGVAAVVCDVFDGPALTAAVSAASPGAIIKQLTDLPTAMNPRRLKAIDEGNDRARRDGTANLIAAGRTAGVAHIVVQSMGTSYRPVTPTSRAPARRRCPLDQRTGTDRRSGTDGRATGGRRAVGAAARGCSSVWTTNRLPQQGGCRQTPGRPARHRPGVSFLPGWCSAPR